jgi:glutamine amidotransferase
MQLLGKESEENTSAECLDIFDFKTENLAKVIKSNSVPHIGWNQVSHNQDSKLFKGIPDKSDFYFSHSYAILSSRFSISTTNFEIDFVSTVNSKNVFGVQFHPERSQKFGIKLLENFLSL